MGERMERERHRRLMALFDELCDLPAAAAGARLEAVRGEDGELAASLEEMLAADRVVGPPLDRAAASTKATRLRMLREAQAASALNHPGIVTLHDVGLRDGRLFLVMELVDGESFHELAERGVPGPRRCASPRWPPTRWRRPTPRASCTAT
jgi:hypothetical protein